MNKAPFHRPLPLDAATGADWDLACAQAAEEHVAWLRLRGFIAALLNTWPKGKTWVFLALGPTTPPLYPLGLIDAFFGKDDPLLAHSALRRRACGRGQRKNAELHPSVVAWLSRDEEFFAQFKQIFYNEQGNYAPQTPETLAAFLALPLREWSRHPATGAAIAQGALEAVLPPAGPDTKRPRP